MASNDSSASRLRQSLWLPSLYFAEGLPYAVVMTLAVVMYKRMGIGNVEVAFYTSWLYLPWVIKALWSPFVDLLSTRRAWVLAMQFAMAVAFGAIAWSLPGNHFFHLSLGCFWALAFLSATHDIAADGFYMLALDDSSQAWWVGLRSSFYRAALVAGQGATVYLAGRLEERMAVADAWQLTFAGLSLTFLILGAWHIFTLPHPRSDIKAPARSGAEIMREFALTFRDFFAKPGVWLAIAFIFLYRLPEAQLVKMITPFMLDSAEDGGLAMTTAEVGFTYGVLGISGLLAGGIIGGFVAARGGLQRWIMPMALAMSVSCAAFLYLAFADSPSVLTVDICVVAEQFGYGFGLTAFTLYLLYFSDGPRRTAYYAICTGFMALGMMLPGMAAGWIQQTLSYDGFFIWTMICCVATIAIAAIVRNHLHHDKITG